MEAFAIAFINRKGGCAKTSTTFHLGGELARRGLKVLLVDTDPQASLTQGLYGLEAVEALPPAHTIAALFDDATQPDPQRLIRGTPVPNLSILPGSHALEELNSPRPRDTGEWQLALRSLVSEVKPDYNAVLIDCPPTLGLCSWNAVLAADHVIVPLQPEDYGAQGIYHIQRFIDQALLKYNPSLKLMGYLLTMVQPKISVHIAFAQQLRTIYGDKVFGSFMPLAVPFKEAILARLPVSHHKPKSPAAKAVEAIASELLVRAERLATEPAVFLTRRGVGA